MNVGMACMHPFLLLSSAKAYGAKDEMGIVVDRIFIYIIC